jgi:hypothetical protein
MAEGSKSWFSKFLRGILKLSLASLIISIVNAINIDTTLVIGNSTYDLSVLVNIIKFAVPFYLIFSALKDLGIEL